MRTEGLEKTLIVPLEPSAIERTHVERQGTLTVLVGADVGATFALIASTTLIGRSPDSHITIEDDGVSRKHTAIVRCGDGYEVEDLGSTNGTFLCARRICVRTRLEDGARIQIGNTQLRFALQDEVERDASKRIYEMSVRDGLTGVFNRRYFDERLTSEFAFAARHGAGLCVLLADIDHFKRVNDRWGHQAGDAVLRGVVAELRKGLRTEDVVARYGGEEFAMLARGIDVVGARLFAERVRSLVEGANISWEGERIAVTVSIGLAHNHAGLPVSKAEQLVAAADQGLYLAKRNGRNRVERVASPGQYSAVNTDKGAPEVASPPMARPVDRKGRYWDKETAPSESQHFGDPGIRQSDARAKQGRR
jgi:two-component system cell cycle response regulator